MRQQPSPTYWIEHKAEGSPPPDSLLVILANGEDEEGEPMYVINLGYWSSKLETFLEITGLAIEEESFVTHYHVLISPAGNPIYL